MNIVPLIGPSGKIPILLRDDDTNFFTQSNKLNSIYSEAWKKHFKLSLSIIPYQISMKDPCVPPDHRDLQNCYSIEKNEELCVFLKEKIAKNHVEIIQHGLTHNLSNGRGEFSKNPNPNPIALYSNANLKEKISAKDLSNTIQNNEQHTRGLKDYVSIGRNILKKGLDVNPLIFVPPYDDISYENINMISRIGMIPVYGESKYHKLFRSNQFPNKLKSYLALKIMKKFINKGFIIPLTMSNLDYFCAKPKTGIVLYIPRRLKLDPISKDDEELISDSKVFLKWVHNTITHCKINRNPICILNHYHHYFYDWHQDNITRDSLFSQWRQILNLLDKISFSWKTNFSEVYQRINSIRKIKIAETGEKITIQSTQQTLSDVSFRVNKKLDLKFDTSYCDPDDEKIVTIKKIKPGTSVIFYLR